MILNRCRWAYNENTYRYCKNNNNNNTHVQKGKKGSTKCGGGRIHHAILVSINCVDIAYQWWGCSNFSDGCSATAAGRMSPHFPWKWNLQEIKSNEMLCNNNNNNNSSSSTNNSVLKKLCIMARLRTSSFLFLLEQIDTSGWKQKLT